MGFLIRFIHNRDLAAENVVTAFMRQQFVLSAPPETLESLHAKLERAGLTLPVRSLLNTTKAVLEAKGNASGEFVVDVPRNERKEHGVDLTDTTFYAKELSDSAKTLFREFGLGRPNLSSTTLLGQTIRINGRPYRVGDHCEFALHVRRSQSARATAPEFRGVGIIKAFYIVPCGSAEHILVSVVQLPVDIDTETGLHKLNLSSGRGSRGQMFTRMIHVDNITFKVHKLPPPLVPGTDEEDQLTTGEGPSSLFLRIWEAR